MNTGDKRYMIVRKVGEKHKVVCSSNQEAQNIKNSLVLEMSDSNKREYVYTNFRTYKKGLIQVSLHFIRNKIDSKLTTLKNIDEVVMNRYGESKEIEELKSHLSNFRIAYKFDNKIEFLELLNPEEFEYVKSPESLYNKILILLENPKYDIFKFFRQNKLDSMKDLRDDWYRMLAPYNKRFENGIADFQSGIYNLILQLYTGDGKNIQYKRFRCFGIEVKKELERIQNELEKNSSNKQETDFKDIQMLDNLFDPSNPPEPEQMKLNLEKY